MGIAHLLTMAMAKEGVSHADAVKKIWMVDSKGLIVKVTVSYLRLGNPLISLCTYFHYHHAKHYVPPTPCLEMDLYDD